MKICTSCTLELELSKFSKQLRGLYGKRSRCKKCEYIRTREWILNNPDKMKLSKARFYLKHKEEILSKMKEDYAGERRDRKITQACKWNKDNLERRREISRKGTQLRRARMNNSTIELSKEQWEDIMYLHNDRCFYCMTTGKMEMDHVFPISKGGEHSYWNVVPACRSCNAHKAAKIGGF